ncbi:MAG: phosphatase PAP2 family protein [Elusimicrobia bacterium]|nr:phosphatase PAP2 family protein [Elusimicrobiota bacterium]
MKAALALLLCLAPALQAAEAQRFAWDENWPRFRTSEYVVTGLALAGAAADFYLASPPKSSAWKGEILFDKGARNTLMARSEAGQKRASTISDLLTYPLIGYSMLDGPITAGWVGGNKDTAIQLSLITAETFAVNEVLNLTVSSLVRRSRPEGDVCAPGSKYDPHCARSFWSGHTANVFAAASLVCAEHGALELYGGKADAVACGTSLAAASAVGVLRIVANDHHASDVIVGAAIGAATGYLMPNLLHFKSKRSGNQLGYLIPNVGPNGGGLTYVKAW